MRKDREGGGGGRVDKKEEVLTSHEVRLERWKGGGIKFLGKFLWSLRDALKVL